jgi:isopenicillin-N N-acyltransferase-like protein
LSTDQKFPHLVFSPDLGPKQRGHIHGETYSKAIKELCEIRRELMLSKSPHLRSSLSTLSKDQYSITKKFFPQEWTELEGIRTSSDTTIEDIVILNNYTDFRDINLPEEGCTTVGINRGEKVSGQTWDMHSTAKNYVCTMEVPGQWQAFSLVGCLGMMGVSKSSLFVGVNNLNTRKAKAGVIWPALVRSLLRSSNLEEIRQQLTKTPVTSGHNYLISNGKQWENWEIGASFQRKASEVTKKTPYVFHTNHCIDSVAISNEEPLALNSTSQNRYDLMNEKVSHLNSMKDVIEVLQNHDSYPKSICSHFQSNATDPSTTCGGAVYDHSSRRFYLWRCCPKDKEKFISRELVL